MNLQYTNRCHSREDNIKEWIDGLKPKSIFYDLGANLGWFSLYAASKGLETYAFEIDKQNFEGLKKNCELNGFKNHHAFNLGIADSKRKVKLRKSTEKIGEHLKTLDLEQFSADDKIVSYNYVEEVEVNSLDNIITELKLPYPEAIKVDIDGSEFAFLLGATKTLEKANSLIIELFEKSKFYPNMLSILEEHSFVLSKKYPIPKEEHLFNFLFVKN